tara:strand:+ start:1861 stop:3360 length:1500 start_codon:yes stop_codon:yes gene_type:complete
MISKNKFLTQRREIVTSTISEIISSLTFEQLDSRTKRNKKFLEYFLESITYYFSYHEIKKFNAGIYNADFRNPEFIDKDDELIGSGYYYSVEPTGIDLIKKTDELFKSKNENIPVEIPLLSLKASEIVEQYAPENYQELIDNTIGSFPDFEDKEELDSRKRFNYLVSQNIERALIRYGESREQTSRELIHSNFRKRVEDVLTSIPGIIISDDKKYFSLNKKAKRFLDETHSTYNIDEKRILSQKLENELKKFDSHKKGISRKELEEAQIRREQGKEVNAPQIYRSKDLLQVLTKLLKFKVNGDSISFSKNDIFELFQRDVERFGQVAQRPEENDIDDYLNNGDFQSYLDINYDDFIIPETSHSYQEKFIEIFSKRKNKSEILSYVFITMILFTHEGILILQDLNNIKNTCSIDTSGRELKTNEKKKFKKFIFKCFNVEIDVENDKTFGSYLLNQKNNLEKILNSMEYTFDFEQAINILKEIVSDEYVSILEKEMEINEQ